MMEQPTGDIISVLLKRLWEQGLISETQYHNAQGALAGAEGVERKSGEAGRDGDP